MVKLPARRTRTLLVLILYRRAARYAGLDAGAGCPGAVGCLGRPDEFCGLIERSGNVYGGVSYAPLMCFRRGCDYSATRGAGAKESLVSLFESSVVEREQVRPVRLLVLR